MYCNAEVAYYFGTHGKRMEISIQGGITLSVTAKPWN